MAYKKKWVEKNPIKILGYAIKKYGLTSDQFEKMKEEQNGVCAICKGTNKGKRLFVDHCHSSTRVRGLLCNTCNLAIGLLKNKPELGIAMSNYLKENI